MSTLSKTGKNPKPESSQVFRQFTWNLAGTLSKTSSKKPRANSKRTTANKRTIAAKKVSNK
ncbi:MAG: hypothetical protein L3J15_08805 [Devosiaceae bacterium]|nr:hypothetical protein [Devosiaceae bacterium]